MSSDLSRRYPSISDLERKACKRIPFFAWEYLSSGTGLDDGVSRNRQAMQSVTLVPQFMQGLITPEIETELFGTCYGAPFGVAPVGLTGLMWPDAELMLARTAAANRIPYGLSTVATHSPETVGEIAGDMGWFQLYPPRDPEVRKDILARAKAAGFKVLMVTVDVPTGSTRERQRRAGVAVPPPIGPRMIYRCAVRPAWSWATLKAGMPRFRGLEKYVSGSDLQHMNDFIGTGLGGTLDWKYLEEVRALWDGPIVLKGVLGVDDARRAVDAGYEGIGVSNHGARQCDGVPAAITVLPEIAEAVDGRAKIIFDSGVRGGLDVLRALALGADYVLLGRAFMFGVTALGQKGADLAFQTVRDDLINNMHQLGIARLSDVRGRLYQAAGA